MALAKEDTGQLRGRAKFGVNLKELRVQLLVPFAFSLDLSTGKIMGQSRELAVLPARQPTEDDKKVETGPAGSPELDSEFVSTFRSAPSNVTRSIDAAVQLIETDLRAWWWNCRYCEVRNGASLYAPGSSRLRANLPGAKMSPEYGSDPANLRLLQPFGKKKPRRRNGARHGRRRSGSVTGASFLCDKDDGEMCYRSYVQVQMRMIGY
jgi:hypothetical protein